MVQTMENKPAEIVAEVFRHSGTRLTEDDPIVVMLMMQDQSFEAAAKLEKYREQLLAELAQYANGQIAEAEHKIYGAVYQRIARDVEVSNERLVKRLEKLLIITLSTTLVMSLLAVLLVWSAP